MKTKIVELPKEVIEKAEITGNIFDELEKQKNNFETIVNKLCCVLTEKYKISTKQWNEDIAPVLRIFLNKKI